MKHTQTSPATPAAMHVGVQPPTRPLHDPHSHAIPPRKAAGEYANDASALAEAGWTQSAIAQRLGVSQSTVSRMLASSDLPPGPGPCERAIDALAAGFPEATADQHARIEAAKVLASRLDWARNARTGAGSIAAASLSRELTRLIDEITATQPGRDFLDELTARRAQRLAALTSQDQPGR